VYLPEAVFSHGQVYVALSRATWKSNIKILVVKGKRKDETKNSKKQKRSESLVATTPNIVYREVDKGIDNRARQLSTPEAH
jgi:ATP-dependent DNA helicase PIF1